jgi:uncharacterized protein YegL
MHPKLRPTFQSSGLRAESWLASIHQTFTSVAPVDTNNRIDFSKFLRIVGQSVFVLSFSSIDHKSLVQTVLHGPFAVIPAWRPVDS